MLIFNKARPFFPVADKKGAKEPEQLPNHHQPEIALKSAGTVAGAGKENRKYDVDWNSEKRLSQKPGTFRPKEGGHSCPPFNGGLENPPSLEKDVYRE